MQTVSEQKKYLPAMYAAVAGVLREGKAEAVTSKDIVMLTGASSKRDVMEIIEQLVVKHGYVIGSSRRGEHRGYYLISNASELQETLHTYNEQIQSMMKRHKKLNENYIASKQFEME